MDLDGFVKSSNSRRANFVIMRGTFRTLNDYEMQHNAEVGLFTRPSIIDFFTFLDLTFFLNYHNQYLYHYFQIVSIGMAYGQHHKKNV